jgi:ribonucleoside-triphosphate reductase
LDDLFRFTVETFKAAKGRRLTSLECHDLMCKVGDVVVVGGVRRSALISLSNLSDPRMRGAKNGQWWQLTPHRRLANNSAVYDEAQPSMETFMTEWKSLYDSKSGERGIFSRYAARNVIKRANDFRKEWFGHTETIRYRETDHDFGTNPCSEIILRDKQCCNLSEIIVRADDDRESLMRKAWAAAIFGTWQSTLTDFRFVSKKWRTNTEDERLLGVSMTGQMDNPILNGSMGADVLRDTLLAVRQMAVLSNMNEAGVLGIPMATAVTAVKPSGTVSSLCGTASGMHARHAPYYVRTARQDRKDPLTAMMIDAGVYHETDVMNGEDAVFYFPQKAPEGAVTRSQMTALRQLDVWKAYQLYWCEHKPSVSISVKENEWMSVGAWVYDNFEWISGISFFPFSDHVYKQAPFQDCTEDQYNDWLIKTPESVDWTRLQYYESGDTTLGSQTLACSAAGGCDL